MGRFQGLSGIKTNQGGLYFLDGDYLVELDEVKMIVSRKKQDTWIVSGKVLESTNPQRAPGCKPSQVIVLKEEILETCMGNIKAFAAAVLGIVDPDAYVPDLKPGETPETAKDRFWDETLEALVSEAQPAKGLKIKLNVTTIKTKAGKDFGKHQWTHVAEKVA